MAYILRSILVFYIIFNLNGSGFSGSAQTVSSSETKSDRDFSIGKIETIQSKVLDEERTINVYLPDGYSPDSARFYPVIYLLDGSANEDFIHVSGLVQFLQMIGSIPPAIVVGIANVDRKRDEVAA